MRKQQETTAFALRIPPEMKAWVERQAAYTLASQNSEILRCIRARMETEQARAAG